MKKFWSLLLVVVMVLAVLAVAAGCGEEKNPETTAQTTTVKATDATTTTEKATTVVTTEQTTTTETTTTTEKVTTKETTTEKVTTETTTTETTKATEPPVVTTTGAPIFARFDFGTKTYAEDNGLTTNEYLMSILAYDESRLQITFKEDSWEIWTKKAGTSADGAVDFALRFDDLVTFDFDDELKTGGAPNHRYVKMRLIHNTTNNMMGIAFRSTSDGGWYTTTMASNMYIVQDGNYAKTSAQAKSEDWIVRIYDMLLCSSFASGKYASGINKNSTFKQQVAAVEAAGGSIPGNNWSWGGGKQQQGLRFNFFCGTSTYNSSEIKDADTRANVERGAYVDVDYVVFGSSTDQLATYKSYMEQKAEA